MALPHLVTDSDRLFVEKVIRSGSKMPNRDLCIWACFLGTPCFILELNRIQIGDVVGKNGKLNKKFLIRGEPDITGAEREIFLTNKKIQKIILNYLTELESKAFCRGDNPDHYRGFDPLSPLFVTAEGKEFALTKVDVLATENKKAHTLYKPNSLRRHIMELMREGGIENPSSHSWRRTFATNLKRQHVHEKFINHLLGSHLDATRRLIGNDPQEMGPIAAKAY